MTTPVGELVSGHHMRHARAAFPQCSDDDASRRKRDARAARALGIVHALEQRIPRGFYRESAIAPQQLDYQLIERLRSRSDDDALGGDIHAAVFAQVSGNCPTQTRRPSAESGLRECCGRLLHKRPAHHAVPRFGRGKAPLPPTLTKVRGRRAAFRGEGRNALGHPRRSAWGREPSLEGGSGKLRQARRGGRGPPNRVFGDAARRCDPAQVVSAALSAALPVPFPAARNGESSHAK